jgi:hypothetical protein
MSKREAPMTEGFWLSQTHGLFISEFPLVQAAADRGVRRVDGLILPDEPHGRGKWRDYASLTGRRVIIVQAKVGRMKMSLNGMVRPCSCPASDESGKGLQRQRSTPCPRTSTAQLL